MHKLTIPFNDYIYGGLVIMAAIVLIFVVFFRKQRLENLSRIREERARQLNTLETNVPQIVTHDYWTESFKYEKKAAIHSKQKKRVHFAV